MNAHQYAPNLDLQEAALSNIPRHPAPESNAALAARREGWKAKCSLLVLLSSMEPSRMGCK